MSHSTIITISTSSTTFSFRYDTRQPAEMLNLGVNQSIQYHGHSGVSVLADIMKYHVAGDFETQMVKHILDQSKQEAHFMAEADFRNEIEFDSTLRNTLAVLQTFENVVRSTLRFKSQTKYTHTGLGLTSVDSVEQFFQEAIKATTIASPNAMLAGIVNGFTGSENQANETPRSLACDVLDWLQEAHSFYMDKAAKSKKHEYDNVFSVTVQHLD